MSEVATNNEVYETLTPQRKFIYDKLVSLFEKGADWRQGLAKLEVPVNAATRTRYKGNNFMSLMLAAMDRGYTDNRWLTYKQMKDRDWDFKTDAEGNSLGRGAGVTIEYYTMFDKEEQKPFDRSVLIGMDEDERQDYLKNNVRVMRKFYRVFNGDIIDGIPEKQPKEHDESGYNMRDENSIAQWSDVESSINGGHGGAFAEEELRTEFASMFLGQDLGVNVGDNSSHIQNWLSTIKSDPNVLFKAIADADKIAGHVMQKEPKKQTEPFAIVEDTDEFGEPIYRLYMTAEYGQVRQVFASFHSREEVMKEIDEMSGLPFFADKELKEVSLDELRAKSIEEAEKDAGEDNSEREKRLAEIQEKPSEEYILPSEIAAKAMPRSSPVDMSARGIDSLKKLDDRAVVEKAMDGKYGTSFSTLYSGGALVGDETLDESSLLKRLAVYTSDKEQLLRILKSSGQYRDEKPNSHYERLIKNALDDVSKMRQGSELQPAISPVKKGHVGANAK